MTPTTPTEPFETQTMAELHARQGRPGEALAIYQRLCDTHPRHPARGTWETRVRELAARLGNTTRPNLAPDDVAVPAVPGVAAVLSSDRHGRGCAIVAWALPATPGPPALEVLLVLRTPDGVDTRRERLPVTASSGRVVIPADGLHAIAAAAGYVQAERFVPLARSTAR